MFPDAPHDRAAVLEFLRLRRPKSVHSRELRIGGFTGNPSERMRELRDEGCVIEAETAKCDGRNGTAYTLIREPHESPAGLGAGTSPGVNSPDDTLPESPLSEPAPNRAEGLGPQEPEAAPLGGASTDAPRPACDGDASGSNLFDLDEYRKQGRYGDEEAAA